MSVIIRLQNLPWSANALDIRQYFSGLSIPEGGVHIVGGELGDAFIAFSTDEDARQAFNRNNGKIKEVQITLMLSSRTEMQRVIEAARAQSYAAFMQTPPAPAAVPLPAAVPAVIPAAIPDIKRDLKDLKNNDKKDRRRSRSKSRDRKDRSREREPRKDKRHRDRSRSRSRERKDRRRRDRSRSRGRSRSRERDRRTRDHRKRSDERAPVLPFQRDPRKPMPEVWANQAQQKNQMDVIPVAPQAPSILGTFPVTLDQAKRTLTSLTAGLQSNGFQPNNGNNFNNAGGRIRDSWPPVQSTGMQNFQGVRSDNFPGKRGNGNQDQGFQSRFQRNFQRGNDRNNRGSDEDYVDCCVVLEPFYGSYGEVRRFFHGLFISNKGIKFINDPNGRRTGIVYIQFANRKSKEDALTLNGKMLNSMPVSVSHLDDEDFNEAVDRFIPTVNLDNDSNDSNSTYKSRTKNNSKYFNHNSQEPELKDFTCLTVQDLPTYCKEQDILHIFSQHPLVALILTTKPRGGNIAYVKFSSKEVAKKAFEERGHHIIGGKQVTVKPCKDDEFEEINKQHEVDLTGTKEEDIGTDCLSVSQLPPKTNDKDIADFFSDIGVIPTKIHLMSNNMGFTGQAYCEFLNTEEASRASKKDDTMLGNIHIAVNPITREEMMNILGHTLPAPAGNAVEAETSVPPPNKPNAPQIKPVINQPVHSPGNSGGNMESMGPMPDFMPMGGGHQMNRPFYRNFDNGPGRGGPRFGPRGMGPRGPRFPPMQQQQEHYEDSPLPGCTVYMKNVPYKAGTNEILDFFDGYNITHNVSRRYNPNNTPSDEAKVVFFDPDEAYRAVQELHHQKIWDRQIFLRQE